MTIELEPLQSTEDLRSAVDLQKRLFGEQAGHLWKLPHLVDIQQSGGLLLGGRVTTDPSHHTLDAVLIDLLSTIDGYAARRTIAWGVCRQLRNRGIGTKLRFTERIALQRESVDLVYWDTDPLNSLELHIALNKLGAILVGYACNLFGSSRDPRAPGLATDRVRCEWWLDSPRVVDLLDHKRGIPYEDIGLNEMVVLTKTTLLSTGVRGIMEHSTPIAGDHILVEIPESLEDLQMRDFAAAIQWRLQSRYLMEQLFALGYLGIGLIHEGKRSFLLFKKGTRRTELGSAAKRQQRRL